MRIGARGYIQVSQATQQNGLVQATTMTQGHYLNPPEWRNSASICALADGERHYGHIVKIDGRWYAFDATHPDAESSGFRRLGSYASNRSAKQAVERGALHLPMELVSVA